MKNNITVINTETKPAIIAPLVFLLNTKNGKLQKAIARTNSMPKDIRNSPEKFSLIQTSE